MLGFTKLVENAKKTGKTKTTLQSAKALMLSTLEGQNEKAKKTHTAWLNLEND